MLFGEKGYREFGYDEQVAKWAEFAKKKGNRILADPAQLQKWLQCEGTWFVGVDVLPNDSRGDFINTQFPNVFKSFMSKINLKPYHKAQLSVIFPGYPKPRIGDSEAAFEYRRKEMRLTLMGFYQLVKKKTISCRAPRCNFGYSLK